MFRSKTGEGEEGEEEKEVEEHLVEQEVVEPLATQVEVIAGHCCWALEVHHCASEDLVAGHCCRAL